MEHFSQWTPFRDERGEEFIYCGKSKNNLERIWHFYLKIPFYPSSDLNCLLYFLRSAILKNSADIQKTVCLALCLQPKAEDEAFMDTCLKGDKNKAVSGGGANTWLGGDVNNLKKSTSCDATKGWFREKWFAWCVACRCLLMRARSAEGGGVAVGFLQVRQSLLVQLHGVPGQPALDLPISPLKSAAQKWRYQCHRSRLITHRLVLDDFFLHTYAPEHSSPPRLLTFVCAPCDSRGCQPLMQDEKHKKT